MSYSVIGNDSIGLYHTDWYEVEVEDEDTGDYYETEIEGDFVREGERGFLRGELGENLFACPPFLVALFAENQLTFQNRVYARQD